MRITDSEKKDVWSLEFEACMVVFWRHNGLIKGDGYDFNRTIRTILNFQRPKIYFARTI